MKINTTVVAGLMALTLSGAVLAKDALILTGETGARGTAVALDFSSSGAATAFEFRIAVAEGDKATVDLSGCLKGLPSTHTGQCAFAKGSVIGIVYSDTNALLPKGMLSLGTIGISSKARPAVTLLVVSDAQGGKLPSSVELGSEAIENKRAAQ